MAAAFTQVKSEFVRLGCAFVLTEQAATAPQPGLSAICWSPSVTLCPWLLPPLCFQKPVPRKQTAGVVFAGGGWRWRSLRWLRGPARPPGDPATPDDSQPGSGRPDAATGSVCAGTPGASSAPWARPFHVGSRHSSACVSRTRADQAAQCSTCTTVSRRKTNPPFNNDIEN